VRHLVLGVVLATACSPGAPFGAGTTRHTTSTVAEPATDPAASSGVEAEAPAEEAPATSMFRRYFARSDSYELDDLDRAGPERGKKPTCAHDAIVAYGGKTVRYDAPASVHRAFVERLAKFEELVAEVAIEVYGRAPKLLHHAGGYMCRTSWRGRLSEHAFGNALDVAGFTFGAISKDDLAKLRDRGIELGASERRTFRIGVGETWRPTGGANAKHFFAVLLDRVRARDDVFRGMIGPPDPAHTTHLHLDAGPWAFSRYLPPG
jgi:hypothetical protein